MAKVAVLAKVIDAGTTAIKLPKWTSENPKEIIRLAKENKRPVITEYHPDECKKDLEKDGAAVVDVENLK